MLWVVQVHCKGPKVSNKGEMFMKICDTKEGVTTKEVEGHGRIKIQVNK